MKILTGPPVLRTVKGHQWRTYAIFAALAVLCALSFLKYLGWAAFYSGNPSATEAAGREAELFFWASIALEVLAALTISMRIRLEGMFLSRTITLAARYAMGLFVSVVTTAVVVGVLVTIGARLRR